METSHGAQGLLTEVPWQVMAEMCHVAFTFKSLPLPLKWQHPSPIIRNKYQNKDTPSQSDKEQAPTSLNGNKTNQKLIITDGSIN